MDVLVVVGDGDPPEWLALRAGHVMRTTAGELNPDLVAHIRTHIPRMVGVYGSAADDTAERLGRHGFPVSVVHDDAGAPMEAASSLLDLVGNTPMVRLDRMARNLSCHLLAKLEFLNVGGSVKDRPAVAMIEAAERDGRLQPGGTIVEPTSGNTGVGLAIVAARRKYRCVFVMPDKMSAEKIALLRAYGAEVVVCPTAVPPEHPDSYYSVSDRLAAEIPGGFKPDQYHNPANPESHIASTGPEIWRQTAGRVTHFVAGIGTGGTITGVGRSLKSFNPDVQIVGADPEGSVYSGGSGRPYLVEGIGEDFWPTTYDPSVVDRVVMVSDRDSFLTARAVTREEGILVGGSAGTAVWAAQHIGAELGPSDVVVILIPDSGRGYLSKLYNDGWMADYGFLRAVGPTIADVLARKGTDLPTLVHVHPEELGRDVIALLREYQVSQVPVVKAEPPLAAAEVVGSISERDLLDRAFTDTTVLDRPVAEVMAPPLPTVGIGESVEAAVEALEGAWAVLVLDSGHPVGIVTRSDLLDFLARR
jgi:cystathionine beta-synthase